MVQTFCARRTQRRKHLWCLSPILDYIRKYVLRQDFKDEYIDPRKKERVRFQVERRLWTKLLGQGYMGHFLDTCYSTELAAYASPDSLSQMQNLGSSSSFLHQSLHFNKVTRWCEKTFKLEKGWPLDHATHSGGLCHGGCHVGAGNEDSWMWEGPMPHTTLL